MRILLINHYAGSPDMGMEFRPYYMAREWVKQGHRVDIIAASFSHLRRTNPSIDYDWQTEKIDGIHYHWIKTEKYSGNGLKRAWTMLPICGKDMDKGKGYCGEMEARYSDYIFHISSGYLCRSKNTEICGREDKVNT